MGVFYFNCPYCGQRFECDDADSGKPAVCPACQNEIMIPPPPKRIRIGQNSALPIVANAEEHQEIRSEHCPYCAEIIAPAAITCPHCGRDVFPCPNCGRRGTMDYRVEMSMGDTVKSLGKGATGAVMGSLLFGPIGAAVGGLVGMATSKGGTGYLECRNCGHVIDCGPIDK